MNTKLHNLNEWFQHVKENLSWDMYVYVCSYNGEKPTLLGYCKAFFNEMTWFLPAMWCQISGNHKWEDTSTVGPDSGNMDMTCSRCHEQFHH